MTQAAKQKVNGRRRKAEPPVLGRKVLPPEEKKVAFPMRANAKQARALNGAAFDLGFNSGGEMVRAMGDLGRRKLCEVLEPALPKVKS